MSEPEDYRPPMRDADFYTPEPGASPGDPEMVEGVFLVLGMTCGSMSLDGLCGLCKGDPERCPRTARL